MRKIVIGIILFTVWQVFTFAEGMEIAYSVHAANVGWTGYSIDGETAGTTGQGRQIEAIKIRVESDIPGSVRYNVHAQGIGWLGWSYDNDTAGTTGQKRKIEAIKVQLTGQLGKTYDIRYRVHMAAVGWTGWSLNGEEAGTTGQSRQIEAIEIIIEEK
jgi:uncharacterized protein YjdB